jgi:hypothetical protein
LRGLGLRVLLLTDPLDGLNRREESVEAKKNRKTLKDPATRATHEAWVRLLAERVKPDYYGFASEINTLAAHGDYALYAIIRDMSNRLNDDVKRLSPATKTFVSFQVDDAWDKFGIESAVDHFDLPAEFRVDAIGLSSYPSFVFRDPAEIPDDYYRRFVFAGGGRPLIQVEGGWSSGVTPWGQGSETSQAAYYARLFELLDGVQAELAVLLLLADIDFASGDFGLTPEQTATLVNFGKMGIATPAYQPKAARAVWEAQRAIPWAGRPR